MKLKIVLATVLLATSPVLPFGKIPMELQNAMGPSIIQTPEMRRLVTRVAIATAGGVLISALLLVKGQRR